MSSLSIGGMPPPPLVPSACVLHLGAIIRTAWQLHTSFLLCGFDPSGLVFLLSSSSHSSLAQAQRASIELILHMPSAFVSHMLTTHPPGRSLPGSSRPVNFLSVNLLRLDFRLFNTTISYIETSRFEEKSLSQVGSPAFFGETRTANTRTLGKSS